MGSKVDTLFYKKSAGIFFQSLATALTVISTFSCTPKNELIIHENQPSENSQQQSNEADPKQIPKGFDEKAYTNVMLEARNKTQQMAEILSNLSPKLFQQFPKEYQRDQIIFALQNIQFDLSFRSTAEVRSDLETTKSKRDRELSYFDFVTDEQGLHFVIRRSFLEDYNHLVLFNEENKRIDPYESRAYAGKNLSATVGTSIAKWWYWLTLLITQKILPDHLDFQDYLHTEIDIAEEHNNLLNCQKISSSAEAPAPWVGDFLGQTFLFQPQKGFGIEYAAIKLKNTDIPPYTGGSYRCYPRVKENGEVDSCGDFEKYLSHRTREIYQTQCPDSPQNTCSAYLNNSLMKKSADSEDIVNAGVYRYQSKLNQYTFQKVMPAPANKSSEIRYHSAMMPFFQSGLIPSSQMEFKDFKSLFKFVITKKEKTFLRELSLDWPTLKMTAKRNFVDANDVQSVVELTETYQCTDYTSPIDLIYYKKLKSNPGKSANL